MGFWHTDGPNDVMWGGVWTHPALTPSPRELAAAAGVYSRPVGNLDPDSDPNGAVKLAAIAVR